MAGTNSANDDGDFISGINVTPLVDVVLVLLVIFMVTAPVIYQSSIQVELPKAKTGSENGKTPLELTVTKDGQISWKDQVLSVNDLKQKIIQEFNDRSGQTATITADRLTPHGMVVQLMDGLREIGLTRFSLSVETIR